MCKENCVVTGIDKPQMYDFKGNDDVAVDYKIFGRNILNDPLVFLVALHESLFVKEVFFRQIICDGVNTEAKQNAVKLVEACMKAYPIDPVFFPFVENFKSPFTSQPKLTASTVTRRCLCWRVPSDLNRLAFSVIENYFPQLKNPTRRRTSMYSPLTSEIPICFVSYPIIEKVSESSSVALLTSIWNDPSS